MSLLEKETEKVTDAALAAMFKALGDPTRLAIFNFLRDCGGPVAVENSGDVRPIDGPTVGEVCCRVTGADKITSAVSFHIKELRLAGLVAVERRGKNMVCSINRDAVTALAAFFGTDGSGRDDCC